MYANDTTMKAYLIGKRDSLEVKPIKELDDVTRFPNDILMSYLIADNGLDRDNIVYLLENLHELEGELKNIRFEPKQLEFPCDGFNRINNQRILIHFYDTNVFAKVSPISYQTPDGLSMDHYELSEEVPLNASIFDMAYSLKSSKNIFIRTNSEKMVSALLEVRKNDKRLESFKQFFEACEENIRLMPLLHEVAEIEHQHVHNLESELQAEMRAMDLFEELGFPKEAFILYQHILANTDSKGNNIAQEFLNLVNN